MPRHNAVFCGKCPSRRPFYRVVGLGLGLDTPNSKPPLKRPSAQGFPAKPRTPANRSPWWESGSPCLLQTRVMRLLGCGLESLHHSHQQLGQAPLLCRRQRAEALGLFSPQRHGHHRPRSAPLLRACPDLSRATSRERSRRTARPVAVGACQIRFGMCIAGIPHASPPCQNNAALYRPARRRFQPRLPLLHQPRLGDLRAELAHFVP